MDPFDTWPAIEVLTGSVTMSRTKFNGMAHLGETPAAKMGITRGGLTGRRLSKK